MGKIIIYSTAFMLLFITKVAAQETFETKAKTIADKIENITKEEKATLKKEVEDVNVMLEKGTITKEQADKQKQELAQARATIIENKVAVAQEELKDLVQQKVDGKIESEYNPHSFSIRFNKSSGKNKEKYAKYKDSIYNLSEKRTTSQFVFAAGVNNLATDGKIADSDFRYWGSHFYEWGTTFNTRLLEKSNLLHIKYGFSVMYNNLRPTDNRVFVKSGDQTNLEVSPIHLEDSRMRNVFLAVPVHLEFDFSKNKMKDDKPYFKSHQSVRVGLGGYAGYRIKTKQFQLYENSDNQDITIKQKGDFNVNDFIYGVSAYIGYKETSLYVKYDLNPMFKDNTIKQNNISLGIRFDLN